MNDLLIIGAIAAGLFLLRKQSRQGNGKNQNTQVITPGINTDKIDILTPDGNPFKPHYPDLDDFKDKFGDLNNGGGQFKQDDNPGDGGKDNPDIYINPDDYIFDNGGLTPKDIQDLGINNFYISDWKNGNDLETLQHKY